MNKHSDDDWEALRAKIMGLGERSHRKSHYPELQEKLAELERFKALLDQANDIIFLMQLPLGRLTDVSQSAPRRLGYSREELLQMTVCDLMPAEMSSWITHFFSDVENNLHRREIVTTAFTRRNGEPFPVEMTLRLVPFHDSVYAVAVARDITKRMEALEALMESEEKHRTLVESSSDAIVVLNMKRRIVSCNQAFLNLFGFSKDAVLGKSIRIIHPSRESFHTFAKIALPVIEKEGSYRTEWELRRKDGTVFPVEGTMSAIRNPDGTLKGYVAIIRDVTDRKLAEEELRKHRDHLEEMVRERTQELEAAQKALLQKEKLKTLGALSAEVAHEIRNPLMSIGGFAKRLQKRYPDLHEVGIILNESQRLEKILSRITNYLKPSEEGTLESCVNTVVTESVGLLSPELDREEVAWKLELAPQLPLAYVSPDILTQVVVNLIKNAMKVMGKGTILVIRTHEDDQNIQIDFKYPQVSMAPGTREIPFAEFDEGNEHVGIPLCLRLLKNTGGTVSSELEGHDTVLTVSLLKVMKPGAAKI